MPTLRRFRRVRMIVDIVSSVRVEEWSKGLGSLGRLR